MSTNCLGGKIVIKKILLIIVCSLTMCVLISCNNNESTAQSDKESFAGKFSGPEGVISFYDTGDVLVSFSENYLWALNAGTNDETYTYAFQVGGSNEVVSYNEAEYITIYSESDGTKSTVACIKCKAEEDRIILYPGASYEATFERTTD